MESNFEIVGYFPGVIGKIVETHAVYYHENWGFDVSFETQVATELSDFVRNYSSSRDVFLNAMLRGCWVGSVAIDGRATSNGETRLRWFIVKQDYQAKGLGSVMISKALSEAKAKGHHKIFLWTFKGLDPAGKLYERFGFRLSEQHNAEQWGATIIEQRYELGHLGDYVVDY
jgi:GNAT superfamily N-acetyltransferase